jgi:hypothetical protein
MRFSALLILAATLPWRASADLLVDPNGPLGAITTAFGVGGISGCSSGPQAVIDAGFRISSSDAACINYSGYFNLDDNGIWQNTGLIGDGSGSTTITIDLGGYFSYAGGFISYGFYFDPDLFGVFPLGNDPVITALDINRNVLQSYDIFEYNLGQSSDINSGRVFGISSANEDISYLQISGSQIVMSDISLVSPEPATWMLSLSALAAMALFIRNLRTSR